MYRLLYGRSPLHTFARTHNNPLLMEAHGENGVWIASSVAQRLGIEHHEYVYLENDAGVREGPVRAYVTERIRHDCVYLVHGFGHKAPNLRIANGRGASDTHLQSRYDLNPVSGGAGLRNNWLRIVTGAPESEASTGRIPSPREEPGMTRLAMAIDLASCVGCAACSIACKVENEVPLGVHRLWIRNTEIGTFPHLAIEHRPEACLQCENPPCVPVCPTGCCFVRPDGIVDIEIKKCIGCSACIAACPYDARYMHPKGYVSKCDFCKHRVDEGRVPACVETCPTLCRSFGDLNDPNSPVSIALREARRVDVLRPGLGTAPRLVYLNTPASFGLVGEQGATP